MGNRREAEEEPIGREGHLSFEETMGHSTLWRDGGIDRMQIAEMKKWRTVMHKPKNDIYYCPTSTCKGHKAILEAACPPFYQYHLNDIDLH